MTDTIQKAVGLVRKYVDHPYTSPDTLVLDSDLVRINADNLASLVQHIDAQDAKIKALVEAGENLRETQRAYLASKGRGDPEDEQQHLGACVGRCATALDAALAAAKETTA